MRKYAILCIAFVLLFFALALNNEFEMLGDTQDYLSMSQSFLDGKPLENPSRPYYLPLIMHPPLYSAALAVFFAVFGFSYAGAKIVTMFFALASMLAMYLLLERIGAKHKGLIFAAYSTSIVFLFQSHRILSDTLFMALFLAATIFILEYSKKEKLLDISGIAAGVLLAASFYARVSAGFFLIAIFAYFFFRKEYRKAVLIAAIFAVLVLPWIAFYANHQFLQPQGIEQPSSYLNWANDTWDSSGGGPATIAIRFFTNVFYYIAEGIPKALVPILLPAFFFLRNTMAMPLLLLAGLAVFWVFGKELFRKMKSLFGLYIIIYIIIFSIQPALDNVVFVDRYLFALFPFLLILGADALENSTVLKKFAKPIIIALILVGAVLSIGYAVTLEQRMLNEKYVGVREAIAYIGENADDNEIVVFESPIHLYLNAGNKAVPTPELGEDAGATYAIIDGFSGYGENDLEGFVKVFESGNGSAAVYRKTKLHRQ